MRPIQNGDVIYFKDIKTGTRKNAIGARFKHFGWGLLLGAIPPFGKEPQLDDLIRSMGTIGYIAFDDVGEFLGDEMGAKALAAFEAKYYKTKPVEEVKEGETPATPEAQPGEGAVPVQVETTEPSRLVNINGRPLDA